ncbi:MAG: c-type cytochrome [Nitrospirota bacterium]
MKKILFLLLLVLGFTTNLYAQAKPEHDPLKPRVPPEHLAAAKALKPPFAATPAIIAEGKALFTGKGTCFICHGPDGKGDGPLSLTDQVKVGPRNFTNPAFHKAKTCGEMFWTASNGTKGDFSKKDAPSHKDGSGMVAYRIGHKSLLKLPETPTVTETELWKIVLFERSLGKGTC